LKVDTFQLQFQLQKRDIDLARGCQRLVFEVGVGVKNEQMSIKWINLS